MGDGFTADDGLPVRDGRGSANPHSDPDGDPDGGPGGGPGEFVEAVLAVVERIPAGRVMTYGAIAEYLGRGGARRVGAVMARYGGGVPWHRVVNASGRVPPGHEVEALRRLRGEGTPLRGDNVAMRAAAWWPDEGSCGAVAPGERRGSG